MKRCPACTRTLPVDAFQRAPSRRDGCNPYCHECQRRLWRERYHRLQAMLRAYKAAHPCVDCGETNVDLLEFDHRDPATKAINLGARGPSKYGWRRLAAEIEKCDVRCVRCHRARTSAQQAATGNWGSLASAPTFAPVPVDQLDLLEAIP